MSSKIDAKVGIEKSSFRGGQIRGNFGELGGRRGVGSRFGRKGSKEEKQKGSRQVGR